jgi:hypothetical protein
MDVGAFDINVVFRDMQADPLNESSYDFNSTDFQVEAIRSVGAQAFYRFAYAWVYLGGSWEVRYPFATLLF